MERKKVLMMRKKRLESRISSRVKRSEESTDVDEIKEIHEELKELKEDLADVEEELEAILEEEEDPKNDGGENDDPEERSTMPIGAQTHGNQILGTFGQGNGRPESRSGNPLETEGYMTAFMEYVCRGTRIPDDYREAISSVIRRDAAQTTTADAGAVIPTTILNEIVQKLESYGEIYAKVRKLNVQGGVNIPILTLKPTATWIGETKSSEDQNIAADESIAFAYYGVECKIAQSLLVSVVTLQMFQDLFVPLATEAIIKAVEIAIFKGKGKMQPLGILNDDRIPTENVLTLPEDQMTWEGWHKVKGKMKKAYRTGSFIMNQSTFDGNIEGMTDDHGQPVGRINYGINGEETYRFMGKEVLTVESECLPSYEDAEVGEVFAVFAKLTDYGINTNMQMTVVKWEDHDDNAVKNKCTLIIDGKLIDPNGVLLIKKGAAGSVTASVPPESDDGQAEG